MLHIFTTFCTTDRGWRWRLNNIIKLTSTSPHTHTEYYIPTKHTYPIKSSAEHTITNPIVYFSAFFTCCNERIKTSLSKLSKFIINHDSCREGLWARYNYIFAALCPEFVSNLSGTQCPSFILYITILMETLCSIPKPGELMQCPNWNGTLKVTDLEHST